MPTHRFIAAMLLGTSAPLTMVGCSGDACFPDSVGKTYRAKVAELWDESTSFTKPPDIETACPPQFDLVAGSTFDLRIDGFGDDRMGCAPGKGSVLSSPPGWIWTDSDRYFGPRGKNLFEESINATSNGCEGRTLLTLHVQKLPVGTAVPGQEPPADLTREFIPDVCPAVDNSGCGDFFVIELEELK